MLILAMSLSGSVVFLAILLGAVLGRRVVSPAWVYNMLRIGLIFFCFPLPLYNSNYKSMLFDMAGVSRQWDSIIDYTGGNVVGIEESGRLHLFFQPYIIAIWAIWACGLLLVFIRNMQRYRQVKAQTKKTPVTQSNYLEIFDCVKKELGMKKSVTLLCANDAQTVCTMGIFRKYIVVPETGMTDEEFYYSLKHELIHVKRSDVAWRYICLLAVMIHWFNPLVCLYFYTMSFYCEQSCDAILVQNLGKEERKKYGQLIINMSQGTEYGKWKYQTYLGGSKKKIEWRLTNILKVTNRKKWKEAASLLLGTVILFGGSLTVCAYEGPQVIRGEDQAFFAAFSDKQDTMEFVAEEIRYSEEEVLDFTEFVGDDGTSYNLSELQNSNMERAGCTHSYVSGYRKEHHKNSDGSCKTDYYYANRCSKCGALEIKGYSHTETSTKCTH